MLNLLSVIGKKEKIPLSGMVKSLDSECTNCHPITPMQCVSSCQVYRLRNELRSLRGTMNNPRYMKELFNVLKNETRLSILQIIVNRRYTVNQLQSELKRIGQNHGQNTLTELYLRPLLAVGLVSETRDEYYTSSFGSRITQQLGCLTQYVAKLPINSECYEEALLQSMITGPKTFEDIEAVIPPKCVSRILKRLKDTKLISTPKDRDYIFFFRSKRSPNQEKLTPTDLKVYTAIAEEGVSAQKLAKATALSIRLTYKYLRRLRGKKLVFTRKAPKTYMLTVKGQKLATTLENLIQIVEDTWNSTQQVMHETSGMAVKLGGLS